MNYDININTDDMNKMIRQNYISTFILLCECPVNIDYLKQLSNDELAEQIMILREIKRLEI